MSFESRKYVGDLLERRVACELDVRGWSVSPFGQGWLGARIRSALSRSGSTLRWSPDMIAARAQQVVMIDCKARMPSTSAEQHTVSRDAVRAHQLFIGCWELPLYYVFDNLTVLTPAEVMAAGRAGRSSYYVIASAATRPFDEIFGAPPPAIATALPIITLPTAS